MSSHRRDREWHATEPADYALKWGILAGRRGQETAAYGLEHCLIFRQLRRDPYFPSMDDSHRPEEFTIVQTDYLAE
jgi:hypothetical protein